ncbi:hypothetical protein KI387_024975, partial [Taxus chinensis]
CRMLTWEDGYYEFAKPSLASNDYSCIKSLSDEFETGGSSHHHGVFGREFCSMEDKIGLAVAKMSYQIHSLGEGIVGHVAFTGKHHWVIRQKNCIDKSNSISMPTRRMLEYPDGWQNQFESGIKTIAVVAIAPHGVVQLGSMKTIMEDLEFISHIRSVFGTLQNIPGVFLFDSLQEPLNGKIKGSILPTLSIKPTSAGNPHQLQISTSNSFQDHLNTSMLKSPKLDVLNKSFRPCIISEKNKKIAIPPLASSQSIDSSSMEVSSQHSQFQHNHENINSFACTVTLGPGTKMGETGILPTETISPCRGMIGRDKSLADNQHALFTGLGIGNNNPGFMEQHLQTEIGSQGHLQMPCISTAVQYQSNNNMLAAVHETSNFNSNIDQVYSKINKELSEVTDKELLGEALFAVGSSTVDVLQQENMLPPASELQYAAGQSESSASLREILYANQSTGVNTSSSPKVDVNLDIVYRYPMIYSGCIQTCTFDPVKPFWSFTTGHLGVEPPDLLNGGLLMSEPVRIEQQPWVQESSQECMAGFFEDDTVEKLDSAEGSSKDFEIGTQNLHAVRYDHGGPGEDALNNCNNVLMSLISDQYNVTDGVTNPSRTAKRFQALGSALKKEIDMDACDESLLLKRKKSKLHCFPQLYGISSGSTWESLCDSVHTDMEGDLLYETNSEHLLDAVAGNLYTRTNHGADDNASSKTTLSGLSSVTPRYSLSVRTDTCSAGQVRGLEQPESTFAGYFQCKVDKEKVQNLSCNFDNAHSASQGHVIVENLINDSPPITHLNSWIVDGRISKSENSAIGHAKTSATMLKINRKRSRSGENGRARPKDRQQIQDRVNELREIIPNGNKCSIDSLLERTIKHMIFLQNVTTHAENLKQSCNKKVFNKDSIVHPRDNLEGCASWALELSDQTMGCPIIVENLTQHRQMLVEMLCEEQGLFLEIADIIRGLGLTILKGIIEARNEKIWSHFIVE